MTAADIMSLIAGKKLRVFTTGDMVTLTGMSRDGISHALKSLESKGLLWRVKRGVWVSRFAPDVLPQEVLLHLTAPWPSYVSLESALSEWGIVSQIPAVLHAITGGKPLRFQTPLGSFHIRHIDPCRFGHYVFRDSGRQSYPIAIAEKAVLDTVYFRYRLGGRPNYSEWNLRLLDKKRLLDLAKLYPISIRKILPFS